MKRFWTISAASFALAVLLGTSFFVLPSLGVDVYLSPDETANAVTAKNFISTDRVELYAPYLATFPWMHPRSFVATTEKLLPVGFLGMPLMLATIGRIFGTWSLGLITPFIALSAVIPLWFLMKRFGKTAQVATLVGWMTFPTVILYANRGLFPNLPVLCFAIWSAWITLRTSSLRLLSVAGILAGVAFLIRPVEAIWILPWIGWAFIERQSSGKRRMIEALFVAIPIATLCAIGALIARSVYGGWFLAGYQLRDPLVDVVTMSPYTEASKSWFESWPFGFHPRNVWFNVKSYLIVYLFPWFLIAGVAIALVWRDRVLRRLAIAGVATCGLLALIYGQGLYQDHVRANEVSLANSFLRYSLPVSVVASVSLGIVVTKIREVKRYGVVFATILISAVATFGLWTAFMRDDEGLLQNRVELARYATIRKQAIETLPVGSYVASERSDKIFFPVFPAVSPLPPKERLRSFLGSNMAPLALFLRNLTAEQEGEWLSAGMKLLPVFGAGNETLYRVEAL
jgi:hypothetical protein